MKLLPILLAAATLLGSNIPASGLSVWINEFHYDNAGADEGEFVEVAGVAGTDLTDWRIYLYNGNSGALYDTFALTSPIPSQQNGFGTVSVSTPGIQNGSPDGIALFDGVNVLQFLSYEGTFTAVGGAADGMLSVDVGVEEGTSTPIGSSLRLVGSGTHYSDFTWDVIPNGATPGMVNVGQSFPAASVPVGGSTMLMLGMGILGLVALRRMSLIRA